MLPSYYEFLNSVKILSGKNALENIPFELKNLGAARPIILTDNLLAKIGLVDHVVNAFKGSDIVIGTIFEDIPPDSSVAIVNKIANIYRQFECDSIIAIGGGSVIDTAKGLNILISEETDDLMNLMGSEILTKNQKPFIAVPTTSGTGSEATLVAVIANPDKNVKMEFTSYKLLPDVAILDPRMTISLPPKITASTGMDALVHAIEAYTSIQKNPMSDAYAFAAINLIREYLPRVIDNGKDEEARLAMANASLMAGASFSNSMVGVVHGIGHALGGIARVPHGDAMTILLTHGMQFNFEKVGHLYGELLLPLAGADVYANTHKEERAHKTIEVIKELQNSLKEKVGLPMRLSEVGVKKEDFNRIAEKAMNDGALIFNPREVNHEDILHILEQAY